MFDVPKVMANMVSRTLALVSKELAPLRAENEDLKARIEALEHLAPVAGKDGLSIAEVKQNDDGELIVKMTNGETTNVGIVRGAAGIGFDDLAIEHDGERSLTLRFERGNVVKEFALELPALIDRGVWTPGDYTKGDAVTWGGSLWIAQGETDEKPGTGKSWRLAVKKGRDAKPSVRADG